MDYKVCTKCSVEKPVSEFHIDTRYKDRVKYRARCKSCMHEDNMEWIHGNPDSARAIWKRKRKKDKALGRSWYNKIKESSPHYSRDRSRRHRSDPDKNVLYKETARRHRAANRDTYREYERRYASRHPENVSKKRRVYRYRIIGAGELDYDLWEEMVDKYSHTCLCCRRSDVEITIDHVTPISLGGSNDITNLQPLCRSCNSKKGNRVIDYRIEGIQPVAE
jgi:5-methylcytosine-specific restriction endonuclease McrA